MNNYFDVAYKEALKSFKTGDIPVGCVVVYNDKIIAKAHNIREKKNLVSGHAELLALDKAAKKIKDWQLVECDIYVTLEPCLMCGSAIDQAHIKNVYMGAKNIKAGAYSKYNLETQSNLHFEDVRKCEEIIKNFFRILREKNGNN